jgi:hypothetical protein
LRRTDQARASRSVSSLIFTVMLRMVRSLESESFCFFSLSSVRLLRVIFSKQN